MTPGTASWAYRYYGNPDSAGWETNNLRTIAFCGRALKVHKKAARHFLWLSRVFRDLAPEYANQIAKGQLDDWGYANRYIAGSSVKSNHAFGIAVDINALKNARGRRGDMPLPVTRKAERGGFRWGGSYTYPDDMHFETLLKPSQIKARFKKDGTPRAWYRAVLRK